MTATTTAAAVACPECGGRCAACGGCECDCTCWTPFTWAAFRALVTNPLTEATP